MAEAEKRITDRIVDAWFSKDKTFVYLTILVIIGFVLRVIAALNIVALADDMHFAPGAINFLSSGKLEYWDQSAGLWFAVTDIFYKILGATQLASRFSAVLFGTVLILVVFLLVKEIFKDNKTALIAALLVAISPFHIKSMMAEMDVMAMFFVFLSLFLFIRALNNNADKRLLAMSAIAIGLAIYTKVYALLFIPGMIIFWFYKSHKEKIQGRRSFCKTLILFLAVILIFCLPALTHNYLLYKEKGIMDVRFSEMLGINKSLDMYSWAAGSGNKLDLVGFFFGNSNVYHGIPNSLLVLSWAFKADPIIFVLGLLGIILLWKRKDLMLLLGLLFIFPFVYLASLVLLVKHYLFISLILTIPAALLLSYLSKFVRLRYLAIAIIIFSLVFLGLNNLVNNSIYEKGVVSKLMDFKSSIEPDSIVIVDSRVYRGDMTWALSDRHYLEASFLTEFFKMQENHTKVSTPVYYIECARDDCGWGTIYNQPGFNATMENVSAYFKSISNKVGAITDKQGEYYNIYKTEMNLVPQSASIIDLTHNWWLYPLGYDKQISTIFDEYTPKSFSGILLNNIAHAVLYFSIAAAFLSVLVVLYLLIKELS
jgi:hypothetical protein